MEEQAQDIPTPTGAGYAELGQLVRQLHETLHDMGCDEAMQSVVGELPDTQDRLNYIAQLTEQAAQRTLDSVEKALPLQQQMESGALALAEEWHAADGNKEKLLVGKKMLAFLESLPEQTRETSAQLNDIMMAQDFQDLTGQVIKKILHMAQNLEHQLVNILAISKPANIEKTGDEALLNGPAVNKEGRTDIVRNQEEVDDFLNSLGF